VKLRKKVKRKKRKRIEICDLAKKEKSEGWPHPTTPVGGGGSGMKKVRTQENKTAQQKV